MKVKVCVVTGTRAEFGLLYWVIKGVQDDPELELQLLVTGSHLSTEHGMTVSEIIDAGFSISRSVEILLSSDTEVAVAKSMGLGLISFGEAFRDLRPDFLLVLGDRFEVLASVTAALVCRIPVVHFHGGELTEGAIDDSMRHAITKMSHLHFTSTESYRSRVIQLGEHPDRVFAFGAPGLESVHRTPLLGCEALEAYLGIPFRKPAFLITFHPVTVDKGESRSRFVELLKALKDFPDAVCIFTMPNADMEGRELAEMVSDFCLQNTGRAVSFTSMGRVRYLSTMQFASAVVGNSSSGIIEAPSFGVPTIDIGGRQKGRVRSSSVIHCEPKRESIREAMKLALTEEFQALAAEVENPYGGGEVASRVLKVLKQVEPRGLLRKRFHDMGVEER